MNDLEIQATEILKTVIDPEIHTNVIDGKMIFDLKAENKNISFKFRPTSPLCPIAMKLTIDIKKVLVDANLFEKIHIEVIDHVLAPKINPAINSY